MGKLKAIWTYINSTPWLAVPMWAFLGVVSNFFYNAATTGQWSVTSFRAALVSAVGAAIIALHQLYMPAPGAPPKLGGGTKTVVILALLFAASSLRAQGIPVTVTATASDVHYLGVSYAATHQSQSIDLMNLGANKASILSVAAHEIIVPGANFQVYGVGAGFQPDISGLLSKTNIPVEDLTFAVDGFGGIATLPTGNAGAWEVRGSLAYALSSNVALTTGYAGGGMIGSHGFYEVSAGLTAALNPAANASKFVQKLVLRDRAARAAKLAVK